MARILYGVMGNTHGHVMRTLSLISRLPEHEYCFVGGGQVPPAVRDRWPCLEVPVLRTVHRQQRVSVARTCGHILRCHLDLPRVTAQLMEKIDSWQPDLAICDREFFLPHAARRTGLPCLSIDHSHVMKACRYPVPPGEKVSWALAMINDYAFFDLTRHNLIVSSSTRLCGRRAPGCGMSFSPPWSARSSPGAPPAKAATSSSTRPARPSTR